MSGAGHGRPFHLDQPAQSGEPLGVRGPLGTFELEEPKDWGEEELKEALKKEGIIVDFGGVLGEGGFAKVFVAKAIPGGPLIGTGVDPLYRTTANRRVACKLLDLTVSSYCSSPSIDLILNNL